MKAAKLEIGVGSQKEGARRSVFTNMRCSLEIGFQVWGFHGGALSDTQKPGFTKKPGF
ncbi:hypothetical protein [Microcoleus sp. B5-D4]|uniref:hypothetical protein n=1 Tax=Microcoleus sp. B5-D4 TaxID=2818681 RepID=UPI002FCF550A